MTIADSFFVDSGVSYNSEDPFISVSGLWHLEGRTVAILADGVEQPQQVVVGGRITLAAPAYKAHIGLPYVSDIQTLPASTERVLAFGQTTKANINKVVLRTLQSCSVQVGPDFTHMTDTLPIVGNSAADLQTGRIDVHIEPCWGDDAQVCVRNTHPLPLEILSLALDIAPGG
jgi:hypothetical protein